MLASLCHAEQTATVVEALKSGQKREVKRIKEVADYSQSSGVHPVSGR